MDSQAIQDFLDNGLNEGEIVKTQDLHRKFKVQAFTCNHCNRLLSGIGAILIHQHRHRVDRGEITSVKVPQSITGIGTIRKTGESKYVCAECGKVYSQPHSLRYHLLREHEKKPPLKCEHCDYTAIMPHYLQSHVRNKHLAKEFFCDTCGKGFGERRSLSIHMTTHSGTKSFLCDFENCGKAFAQRSGLVLHRKQVHTRPSYQCKECREVFKSYATLYYHRNRVHRVSERACEVCGKSFGTYLTMYQHRRFVHGIGKPENVKVYNCEHCEYQTQVKTHMVAHSVKHTEARPFVCRFCGLSFAWRRTKWAHETRVHALEKAALETEGKKLLPSAKL